jgi:hypothetical protein
MADEGQFHGVTAQSLFMGRNFAQNFRRQILALEKPEQVTFLQIWISSEGDQNLLGPLCKESLGLVAGRIRSHFQAVGKSVGWTGRGHFRLILMVHAGTCKAAFLLRVGGI